MGDTIRERKQALATVSTSTKIELVEALRREKEKTARHLADARAQRERAKSEALKVKIVVDPSASRPFKDLVARATANHPALTKLDFSVGAWWLSGADVLALAEVLKHNTTVTDVNFHGNSLAAQGAAALADALRVNSCITALNLGGNQITSVGARSLAESLQSTTCALRSLLLYSNAITDDGVFELAFALGGSKTVTTGPDKGAVVTNDCPNTVLTALDLSANVMTDKGAAAMAEIVRKSSSLTHLLLTHNVVRDAGATKMEKALEENWTMLKLALEGNNFDVELAQRMADYVARNNKMHTLSLLQSQNQREFERVKERVQPPPWETGHRPVRFAHEIDISRTDPRMYAALEKAAMLTTRATVRSEHDAILADRARAVVESASRGSNRSIMALYRLTTEGDLAIGALIEAGGIPVAVDLVGVGGGHGTAHESAEAIRQCLLALHAMARFSQEAVGDVISGLGIGALAALLTMDFCVMSNLLDSYVDNDPNGPLEVQEEAARHVWMSVMAESLRILQHLSRESPDPAVRATLDEGTLDKCLELCKAEDDDHKSMSRELRVESIKTMSLLGRFDVALEHMQPVVQRLVECVADEDKEVQFAAAQGLIGLLDLSLESLPSLLPDDEAEHPQAACQPGAESRPNSSARPRIAPFDAPHGAEGADEAPTDAHAGQEHADQAAHRPSSPHSVTAAAAQVRFPPARGALPPPTRGTAEEEGVCDSPTARLLRRQLSEEELRRERRRRQPKHYVTSALVEMFVTCSTRTSGASGCTTVQDKNGRMRVLTHNVSLTGRDVSMHGRTIHGSTSSGQGGLEVAMQAMLMTEHAALRLALLCLLALVTEHECARRRLARSEGKAVIFTLTQVLISAYDDECKLNALWVLGSLLDNNATMQRTTVQHHGTKLLLRMCLLHPATPLYPTVTGGEAEGDAEDYEATDYAFGAHQLAAKSAVSEVPATAAWALGFLWQHPEAVAEAIKQGAVEVMVSLLALQANRTQATEDQALKQAQHAAFALRVLLQGGGRDAVRRCEAVDGLEHLLRVSRASKKKQAVENAVVAISLLTQSSRAMQLDSPLRTTRHGLTWQRDREQNDREEEEEEAGSGRQSAIRSDVSEAPSAQSVAERYLNLREEDFECPKPAFAKAILAADTDPVPYADIKTPTPPPPTNVPTLQQARRELRAKLLRDRSAIAAKASSRHRGSMQVGHVAVRQSRGAQE